MRGSIVPNIVVFYFDEGVIVPPSKLIVSLSFRPQGFVYQGGFLIREGGDCLLTIFLEFPNL